MAISMLKIRRPLGRLIFNMGIAIPGKTVFLIEMAPRYFHSESWLFTHLRQYRIYASVNWVSIGSDSGLLPIWCQAII